MAEAAGLVLAVIPLLISAVEHYEECFRILGCMREFKQEYRKCRNKIKNFELEYDLTLDLLFLDLVDGDDELERLKTNPNDNGWIEIEAKLKERLLPKVHQAYLDTIKDMREAMEELGEELGLDKSTLQKRLLETKTDRKAISSSKFLANDKSKVERSRISSIAFRMQGKISYEVQRLKFSQGKKKRDELLDQIDGYNKSLYNLLSRNDQVVKLSRNNQQSAVVPRGLTEFWRHARNIYSLLSRSWNCPCSTDHCADLRLLHRESPDIYLDVCFRFAHCIPVRSAHPWVCHRAVVAEVKRALTGVSGHNHGPHVMPIITAAVTHSTPEKPERQSDGVLLPSRSALKSQTPRQVKVVPTRNAASSSKVTFEGKSTTASVSRSLPAGQIDSKGKSGARSSAVLQVPQQGPAGIDNLCQAISNHDDAQACLGLLAAHDIDTEYVLSSLDTSQQCSTCNPISLTSLLSDPRLLPDRAQRYSIAVALASSHLQLHSSAWLSQRWHSDDIIFDVLDHKALIHQPHLRTNFRDSASKIPCSPIDDTFVTLGILLLELCFGKTLEQSPFRQLYRSPDGQPDPVMDWAAAQKWAESVEGEAGPEYADAVAWCLGIRRVKPNDHAWRQELLRTVIEPLRSSYQKLTSTV